MPRSLTRRSFLRTTTLGVGAAPFIGRAATDTGFEIGLVADAQYADGPPQGTRHYREGLNRLGEAVERFNLRKLAFCVHLGDLIDRDWRSFAPMLQSLERSRTRWHHLLGNHDFEVANDLIRDVPARLGRTRRHASFDHAQFRFVLLDTNDVSTYAHPAGAAERAAAEQELQRLKELGLPQAQSWNGGVGRAQLAWLERTCGEAAMEGRKVIIFAHHPVAPVDPHRAWNAEELLALVDRHANVVAWFNGHNHAGAYERRNDVSFVTLRGMVETADTTAYATVRCATDRLIITGHGREPSRELLFRRPGRRSPRRNGR